MIVSQFELLDENIRAAALAWELGRSDPGEHHTSELTGCSTRYASHSPLY